jgi:uncharacterized membrane protein YhhN
MQQRLSPMQALLVQSAALATATGADGMMELHRVFKPLTMLIAIAMVAERGPIPVGRFNGLLLAALGLSLAGDCFLMVPGYFVAGLASFLLAHVCYITLFKQGQRWFPSGRALAATLAVGAAMYAFLFPHLDAVLKVAVAAYVVVIACMAAQAIGRASVLRDRDSIAVAIGACVFMVSDSLLATNRFAIPIPLANFWVLGTYYVAQILIATHARTAAAGAQETSYSNNSPALFGGATPR